MEIKNIFAEYKKISTELDEKCSTLHHLHLKHTHCRNGCSECCMNFSVLPVEFHAILSRIKSNPPKKLNKENPESCLFLVNDSCTIYELRPSICRSHGLPILNMDAEGENWELSFCPLNFTKADETYFTLDNGFQQDVFNSKLYLLNRKFIKVYKDESYSENELVELRTMKDYL